MSYQLGTMSRKDLEKLKTQIDKQLGRLAAGERKKARAAAEKAVKALGFSLDEIIDAPVANRGPKTSKGKTAKPAGAPKYAHPENPSVTWTGKGRQPGWYKEALEAGKTPEDLAV